MITDAQWLVIVLLIGVPILLILNAKKILGIIKNVAFKSIKQMAVEEHFSMERPPVGWLRKFLAQQGWCKQTLYAAEREQAYLQCERGSNEIFRIYLEMADNRLGIVLREFNHSENETNLWMYRLDSDHQEDLKELEQYIQRNYSDN